MGLHGHSASSEENLKNLLLLIAVIALTGCVAPRYQWGKYDEMLYQTYKNPGKAEEMRVSLEAHLASLEASKQRVAPGLYAELGTIYLQGGDKKKAAAFYSKEKAAWPESQELMNALIKNIERVEGAKP
jgi:hypothetical protein